MADRLSIKRSGNRDGLLSALLNNAFDRALALDGKVSPRVLDLEGMSGRNYRHFINNLIGSLPDARYLEVGCWAGSTACAAMDGNKVTMLCIDNWTEFGGPKDVFFANIEATRTPNVQFAFLESDFRHVDFRQVNKYNCYLFDGPHERKDQYDGLMLALPALDEEFVFLVDDWNWTPVREGTMEAIETAGLKVKTSIELRTTQDNSHPELFGKHSDWHNGYFLSVLEKR
jgi:Methyltransferase domain